MFLCLRSDYLPGAGWESNTYFPSLSREAGQVWCTQVQLLHRGAIPSEDNLLTPSAEHAKGQVDRGSVFPTGSSKAPSPGTEVQPHPHGWCLWLNESRHPTDALGDVWPGTAQHGAGGQPAARWQGRKARSSGLSPVQLAERAKNTLCTFPLPSSLPSKLLPGYLSSCIAYTSVTKKYRNDDFWKPKESPGHIKRHRYWKARW